jgi:hypothetical protein
MTYLPQHEFRRDFSELDAFCEFYPLHRIFAGRGIYLPIIARNRHKFGVTAGTLRRTVSLYTFPNQV